MYRGVESVYERVAARSAKVYVRSLRSLLDE
jgi:hypothetical protein